MYIGVGGLSDDRHHLTPCIPTHTHPIVAAGWLWGLGASWEDEEVNMVQDCIKTRKEGDPESCGIRDPWGDHESPRMVGVWGTALASSSLCSYCQDLLELTVEWTLLDR